MQEMPSITKSMYGNSSVDGAALLLGHAQALGMERRVNADQNINQLFANQVLGARQPPVEFIKEKPVSARIVKVYIADPNINLPLTKRVLYTGEEQLTDLTDQELFFEVPIADMLKKHNEYRKTCVDKAQAEKFGRDIFLEEARIRDLRMVVVDIAKF